MVGSSVLPSDTFTRPVDTNSRASDANFRMVDSPVLPSEAFSLPVEIDFRAVDSLTLTSDANSRIADESSRNTDSASTIILQGSTNYQLIVLVVVRLSQLHLIPFHIEDMNKLTVLEGFN